MISQEQIYDIIDKTDMVELVSGFVSLEKAGKGYKGLCPFHADNSPSFMIEPTKKIAKCMSCGEGGNPITFLRKIKNISFEQAAVELAEKAGIKLNISVKKNNSPDYSKYYLITDISQRFFVRNLLTTKSGQVATEYLNKRGINDETINMFGIGLSPNNSDVLYNVLKESKILELDMLDLGLVKSSERGYYDLFTRRIMFPIYDEYSNVVGFSGRIYLDSDLKNKNQAKYVNSPETIIFKKSVVLFNLNNAASDIRKNKRVILYEGFMDVIASYRSGLRESVCSMGTALTSKQASLIRKYSKEVILCYDGDEAGINASIKTINILRQANLDVKLVMLPDGLDPDDYVNRHGEDSYRKYFESNIVDPIEYLYLTAIKGKDLTKISEVEKTKILVFDALKETNSQIVIEDYLKRFSDQAKVSYSSLVIDYDSYSNKRHISKNVEFNYEDEFVFESVKQQQESLNKYSTSELRLFVYAMQNKEKAQYIDGNIELDTFEEIHQSLWMNLIDNYYVKFNEFDDKKFRTLLTENNACLNCYLNDKKTISRIVEIDYNDDDLEKCILTFNEYRNLRKAKNLDLQFKYQDELEQIKLLKKKFDLLREIDKNKKIANTDKKRK